MIAVLTVCVLWVSTLAAAAQSPAEPALLTADRAFARAPIVAAGIFCVCWASVFMVIQCRLNGKSHGVNVNCHMPLWPVLGDTRGMTETKINRASAEERVDSRTVVEVVAGGAQ
jgi:hypothetical protein